MKLILQAIKSLLNKVDRMATEAKTTANEALSKVNNKLNIENPVARGSFVSGSKYNRATGENSHAEGDGTKATGRCSHAEGVGMPEDGEYTEANGDSSHAEGSRTKANGYASHSEGSFTRAEAFYSHAEGNNTTASGDSSHAEGNSTTASGDSSHAEGQFTIANGHYSHAEGYSTRAEGKYQHVQGRYNIPDTTDKYAHIVGNGVNTLGYSNAHTLDWDGNAWFAGKVTAADYEIEAEDGTIMSLQEYLENNQNGSESGVGIESIEQTTTSTEDGGDNVITVTLTDGTTSTFTVRNGSKGDPGENFDSNNPVFTGSLSLNRKESSVIGHLSTTEGSDNIASGSSSHAEGGYTEAIGNYSHTEGWQTIAYGENQHVQGMLNISDTEGKYAHIVGNGYVDQTTFRQVRQNAHTLDWDGNAWFAGKVTAADYEIESEDGTIMSLQEYLENNQNGKNISSIEQTATSADDGGNNILTVTLTDGTKTTFTVRNGSKGSKGDTGATGPQGEQGPKGETGNDGYSMYLAPIAGEMVGFGLSRESIESGDRSLQVGDLLLSSLTGRVYKITNLTSSIGMVSGEYAGFTLKGETGATGPQGPKGDTGATGPQGPKGDPGDPGDSEEMEYVISDAIENRNSVTVVENTGASTSASYNDSYFTDEYLVVNDGPYRLRKDAMISLLDKKMVGNGSVAWDEWITKYNDWASYEEDMLSSSLKVRYSDDPIYMSMKLPPELRLETKYTDKNGNLQWVDFVVRPGMKQSNNGMSTNQFKYLNSLGAIMPLDYNQLPDDVVICIGRMAVYTLSKEENARWELFDYVEHPLPNAAMYYLPWSTNNDESAKIDSSKVEQCDGFTRYRLKKADFAPDRDGCVCKTLHFWGNAYKEIDFNNTLAIIELFEVWTESPGAVGWLYTSSGVDRKTESGTISQAFWGRNVRITTDKTVIAGHNISDAVYDQIRDTGNDPRFVYADYTQGKIWGYEINQIRDSAERLDAAADEIEANTMRSTACFEMLEENELLVPGININPGVYVSKHIMDDGSVGIESWMDSTTCFASADFIPVTGGRQICQYHDPAVWEETSNGYAGLDIAQYNSSKQLIGTPGRLNVYSNLFTLDANTAYIKISYINWKRSINTPLDEIKIAIYYAEDAMYEFVEYGVGAEYSYGISGNKVVLTAPNGTKYKLSVDNTGTLRVTAM